MPADIEVIKTALDDFMKIQKYMILAKEEKSLGVNLTDIDKIN